MRIALIGLGQIAKFQIEALGHLPDIILSDAFDVNEKATEALPANTHRHESLDAMLRNAQADVFMVSTPNVTHFEIASRIVEAGKAVVVEKPICANVRELETLVAAADRRSVFLHVALHASFGADLRWWLEHGGEFAADTGDLIGFNAGFFDPLIADGKLAPAAASFGGSWFDSGINALSVIGALIDPRQLRVDEARMTHVPQIPCDQVQGLAILSFPNSKGRRRGVIDTNWTLGLNRKVTILYYESRDVVLHHSNEKVLIRRGEQILREIDLAGSLPRLTNHYIGVFRDLRQRLGTKNSNIRHAELLHRLLFSALDGGS